MTAASLAAIPLADPVEEARRLLALASAQQLPLRTLGGVAIALSAGPQATLPLPRTYQDIDLITPSGSQSPLSKLMTDAGYLGDEEFNAFNSHRRMLYRDAVNGRQVDIFVGRFAMCHEIPLGARMLAVDATIPLPELLLTKLQVYELNDKDVRDILNLVHLHAPTEDGRPPEGMAFAVVAGHCAADWGLWRTVTLNLERSNAAVSELPLAEVDVQLLRTRLAALQAALESVPKSRKWKLRARIGERVRWYEDVEEVA